MIIPVPIMIPTQGKGHSIADYEYPAFAQWFFTISFLAVIIGIVVLFVSFAIDEATSLDAEKGVNIGILLTLIGGASLLISALVMAFTGTPVK